MGIFKDAFETVNVFGRMNKKSRENANMLNKIGQGGSAITITDPKGQGMALADEIIGPNGLERLGTDKDVQEALSMKKAGIGKQEEMTKRQRGLTDRYEKMADEGMDPREQEALRRQMASRMSQQRQMAGLRMGGQMGGAMGASAAAQQRSMMAQSMQQRGSMEMDLFMANQQAKRAGLSGMQAGLSAEQGSLAAERAATNAYTSSLGEVKTFDIGQAAKERDIRFQAVMGYENMASAERQAEMQAQAALDAAKIQSMSSGTSFLCTALRGRGLMTKEESKVMYDLMIHALKIFPKVMYWYFTNMQEIANNIDKESTLQELVLLKKESVVDVMKTIKEEGKEAAIRQYFDVVKNIAEERGVHFPEDNMVNNAFSKVVHQVKIFMLPTTWKFFGKRIMYKLGHKYLTYKLSKPVEVNNG